MILRQKILLIILFGLLAYSHSFGNPFVWDDDNFIVGNKTFQSVTNPFVFFYDNTKFCELSNYQHSIYRPLRTVIYWLSYRTFGLNPVPLHILSFILHCVNSIMLLGFMGRLIEKRAAFLAAVLFVVHPGFSEAIFSINYMADPLFTMFILFALKFLTDKRDSVNVMLILVSYVLALFSKETALSFLFIYLAYAAIFYKRENLDRYELKLVLLMMTVSAVYFFVRKEITGSVSQMDMSLDIILRNVYILPAVVLKYVALILWPYPLSTYYEVSPHYYPKALIVAAYLTLFAVLIMFFIKARKLKPHFFMTLFFLIGLTPVLNILPISTSMAERFLYFPAIGILGLAGMFFTYLIEKTEGLNPKAVFVSYVLTALMVLALIFLTFQRGRIWGAERKIFEDALKKFPESKVMNINLSAHYYERGNFKMAIPYILKGIELGSRSEKTYSTAVFMLEREQMYEDARGVSLECIRYFPRSYWCNKNLSIALKNTGRIDLAIKVIDRLLDIYPKDHSLYLDRAYVLMAAGKPDDVHHDLEIAARTKSIFDEVELLKALALKAGNGHYQDIMDSYRADEYAELKELICKRALLEENCFAFKD